LIREKKVSRVERYKRVLLKCKACDLRLSCRQVVPGAGELPTDILFQGIAPGKSEDLMGEPFIGPSGRLLNVMLEDACRLIKLEKELRVYKTNSVLCRSSIQDPMSDKFNGNCDPTEAQVLTCMPRVIKLVKIIKPTLIIFLGKLPEKYYRSEFTDAGSLHHPAFLLKDGGVESRYYRQNIRRLSEYLEIFK
jgi:uracil-DNA glycosylase family 4